ncbi:MAG: glycerol-3-phosphate acyltransferase [Boseongicola sp.]|nr:MAG: glycerol-3-phosphate acyltransferase [Boseongicola sp.]
MLGTVELPIWLLALILVFATVTATTHLLFPSVRWFFRRRAERLVAELNKRLDRPIQPFKLLRRQDMIQRVIYDPDVVRAVGSYAEHEGVREDVAFEKAQDYAREIVPSFSATVYFGVAIRLARWLANKLFNVRLHYVDEQAISDINKDSTVVYVINHRSNFDYVLVTYLSARQSAISYAAGEWARVWPLSWLVRSAGAYFIRRRYRGALYRKVLASYVQKATEAGVSQAVFPEGGLSRSGVVGEPKLGILSYIVDGWRHGGREVVFVPVSLNYDRVVEDRILVSAGRSGQRRFRATAPEAIGFTLRYIRRRITGKVGRFGIAAVTFGKPRILSELAAEYPEKTVDKLARILRDDIRGSVPIVTTPLLLAAIFQIENGTAQEVADELVKLRADLPDDTADFAVDESQIEDVKQALEILVLRQLLKSDGQTYSIAEPDVAAYYANSLRHHFAADAALSIPSATPPGKPIKT